MLGRPVNRTLRDGHRILEQPESELSRKNIQYRIVNAFFRNPARLYGISDGFEEFGSLHVNVHSGLYRSYERLGGVLYEMMHGIEPLYVHPVADCETFEAKFGPQQIFQQPGIRMARDAVYLIVRRHHSSDACIHGSDERRQEHFSQFTFGDIHRRSIQPATRLPASDKMLGTGQDMILRI